MTHTTPQSRSNFWLEQVNAAKGTGLSCARFCQEKDLNYSQFMYWRQKFVTAESNQDGKPACQTKSGFAAVVQSSKSERLPNLDSSSLSLTLPNGVCVQGINTHNIELARQLLEAWL